MMNNVIQTAEKEILRKEIMKLCYQAGSIGCSTDVLAAAFAHGGSCDKNELQRQVDYLEGKNLVIVQTIGNECLGLSKKVVKLTAEGIDYMEGNTGRITGIGE